MDGDRKDSSSDRLEKLGEQLDRAAAEAAGSNRSKQRDAMAMRFGFRVASELVAAIVIGALLGLLLDTWLDTKPLFILVFFLLGTVAGFLNVYRVTKPKDAGGAGK